MRILLTISIIAWATGAGAAGCPYLYAGEVPTATHSQFCGLYATWYMLNFFQKPVPLAELKDTFRATAERPLSIQEILDVLETCGVPARAVHMNTRNAAKVQTPHIIFSKGPDEETGHYTFCIPLGGNKILILDGAKPPLQTEFRVNDKLPDIVLILPVAHWPGVNTFTVAGGSCIILAVATAVVLFRRSRGIACGNVRST